MQDLVPGAVAALPLPGGGYGACQVFAVDAKSVRAYALVGHFESIPSIAELTSAEPLPLTHHNWSGDVLCADIDGGMPPPDFVWLGTRPVRPNLDLGRGFTFWDQMAEQIALQSHWDRVLPTDWKVAYRRPGFDPTIRVSVDLGAGPTETPQGTNSIDLRSFPSSVEVEWGGLDVLPHLTGLAWAGPDRGLVAALVARPWITSLRWEEPPSIVDLRGTGLTDVYVVGGAPRQIRLPSGLHRCHLEAFKDAPLVTAADDGRWLSLIVDSPDPTIPAGLRAAPRVSLHVRGTFSGSVLHAMTEIHTLSIRWSRPPGDLTDARALPRLPRLHTIELIEPYGLDPDALPGPGGWPTLRLMRIEGIRKSTAAVLRKRFRQSKVQLAITGARSDEWLAANIDNPFRSWLDDDEEAGKAACRAYSEASKALGQRSGAEIDRIGSAQAPLRALVDRLNSIDERHSVVDTLRREEAIEAFLVLAARAGVPTVVAKGWIDEWREF